MSHAGRPDICPCQWCTECQPHRKIVGRYPAGRFRPPSVLCRSLDLPLAPCLSIFFSVELCLMASSGYGVVNGLLVEVSMLGEVRLGVQPRQVRCQCHPCTVLMKSVTVTCSGLLVV